MLHQGRDRLGGQWIVGKRRRVLETHARDWWSGKLLGGREERQGLDHRRTRRAGAEQRFQQGRQLGRGTGEQSRRRDRSRARMGDGERNAEAVVDERRPALPGVEHLRRIVPRPGHRAGDHLADRVHAEGEGGGDPEVPAATAAQRPEEIGMLLLAGAQRPAIGVDQLDGDEVVAGEPVLAREKADAAAEGQAGDADARTGPGRDRDPVLPQPSVADRAGAPRRRRPPRRATRRRRPRSIRRRRSPDRHRPPRTLRSCVPRSERGAGSPPGAPSGRRSARRSCCRRRQWPPESARSAR